jgi:hypothetical protein
MGMYVDANLLQMEYEERIRKRREPYVKGPFFRARPKSPARGHAGLGQTLQSVARAVVSLLA